jgi:hypothetical protein
MTDPLKVASLSTWAPAGAYIIVVAIVAILVYNRSLPPAPVAAQKMGRNHVIAPGDLETSTITPLIGKHLKQDVEKGAAMTAGMVTANELPPRLANTMAAVINMPLRSRTARKIDVGSDVQICRNGSPFGSATKVIALDCDERVCSVIVSLPKVQTQTVDPDALIDAVLLTASQNCTGVPP